MLARRSVAALASTHCRSLTSTSYTGEKRYYPPPEPFVTTPATNTISIESSPFSTFGASPDLLTHYLSLQPAPLTLRQLMAQGGRPGQALDPHQLLLSAQHTHRELPIRLARRVGGFRALPFIVGSNPFISRIARLYASSFETLVNFGHIKTQEDNQRFTAVIEDLVSAHAQNIPTLARGFQESRKYMDARQISAFLDAAIHSRIAIRMIAEQHLALSATSNELAHLRSKISNKSTAKQEDPHHSLDPNLPGQGTEGTNHEYGSPTAVGIIETRLSPARMTRMCAAFVRDLCEGTLGAAPELILEGDLDVTYTGVPVHLEYVMTELLKNSYRATTENHFKSGSSDMMPPVIVTIAQSANHVSLRIRDQGAGISPQNLPHVFSYAFTTAGSGSELEDAEETGGGPYAMQAVGGTGGDALAEMGKMGLASGLGTLAGLGYGLPMARIYAEYWKNGSALDLVSLYGHGCDTFVKLPRHIELSNTVI
ncbi:related to branched-chain alpha-ketoacid dehydrogenase kinase, mitochondrial precursor [Melanopsichium pennsylvanicum]|uniref:Protein-serine/threonine kinase n=2 Tax=Melanopsichium pennsylvanicum TaxID=63383 RepID=A0AAJ4XSL5_9BASI|nr:related to branched-chain alpha-ketoacid dehydrogenase kinase, mitochondrial precursor [Melanopsichium pennsylvanicum 4]SNX87790.1 related to branched-chain alpha-ketoacid dehydrogenase kinase, mitochondrial precursor [Melanopsichium pennsylvanicum]